MCDNNYRCKIISYYQRNTKSVIKIIPNSKLYLSTVSEHTVLKSRHYQHVLTICT